MVNVFEQKYLSRRMRYTFEEEVLRVDAEDASQAYEFSVPYVEIPFESARMTEKMEALRGAAVVFVVLAALSVARAIIDPTYWVVTLIQLIIAGGSWYGYKELRATFTVIDTERGRLSILDNVDHDAILGEIEGRRRELLRKHFATVNIESDPVYEGRKLEWLRRNGVITDDEFKDSMAEIEGGAPLPLPSGPKTVH